MKIDDELIGKRVRIERTGLVGIIDGVHHADGRWHVVGIVIRRGEIAGTRFVFDEDFLEKDGEILEVYNKLTHPEDFI